MNLCTLWTHAGRQGKTGNAGLVVALLAACLLPGLAAADSAVFERPASTLPETRIDRLVTERAPGAAPPACSDAVFVRRVYLDMLGILPSAREAREFILDPSPEKRPALIDRVLEREEYADYWAMKWGDLLRIKAEFPVNLWPNAAQAYHRWVRAALAANLPYDQFVRELLTSSGSNFRVPPVNFYRAIPNRTPEGTAAAVALTFMGARVESWPPGHQAGLAAFFSQVGYKPTREWKEEIVFWQPFAPASSEATQPTPPGFATFPTGQRVALPPDQDPRGLFAEWLTRTPNPWFNRNLANRAWAWLLGRGIIHEPDDLRPDNPPANPLLLRYLEQELVAGHYDLKHLFRLILNSRTYQSSPIPRGNAQMESTYAVYGLRRLEAEVLIDAINQVTGASDLYTSAIPEPFTYIPPEMRAVALADGSVTSPFLALFGRSARAAGMENERINSLLAPQWLHLLNSSHIQRKLEQGPTLRAILDRSRNPAETLDELYLTVLSRFPTDAERAVVAELRRTGRLARARAREDGIDLAWALINSPEFLYRH